MPWRDDYGWRNSYDAWKTRSPDDEYGESECHHEEFDIDWEGRAHCEDCGETWWADGDQIAAQREDNVEYDAWCHRQERHEFLRRLTYPIRWPIYRLLERIWPRQAFRVLDDSEIPF